MREAYELLGVKPFRDTIASRRDNIISDDTRNALRGHSRRLLTLSEQMTSLINNPSSQKNPRNFEQICDEFILAAAGGLEEIKRIFDRARKIKELIFSVFYDFRNGRSRECVVLLDQRLSSLLWKLVSDYNKRSIRKALLYFLTEYWTELPQQVKGPILLCLVVSIKKIDPSCKNAFDRTLEENMIWLRPDGTSKLAKALKERELSATEDFFSAQRSPRGTCGGLPLFIPFEKRMGYCADVLRNLLESGGTPARTDAYLRLMFRYSNEFLIEYANKRYFSRNDVLRLLVSAIVKAPQPLRYRESLKNTALNRIGDTLEANRWFLWKTASTKERDDVETVRRTIDGWMREDILSIFFEKLVVNRERRDFWLRYVKSMSETRIFCNARDRATLSADSRLQNDASRARLENSALARQEAPVLVMQIRDMVIVEVAAGGNALYVYKRHNLEAHSLTKFAKALNGEKTPPLSVAEFKNTSLERLEGTETGEGRFRHGESWQLKLTRWLSGNGINSANATSLSPDVQLGRLS